MARDDLETGPGVQRVWNGEAARPKTMPPKRRIRHVLLSYTGNQEYCLRRSTEDQAKDAAKEVEAAVRYLNRWEFCDPDRTMRYDLRVRPKIVKFISVGRGGKEYAYNKGSGRISEGWYTGEGRTYKFYTPEEFAGELRKAASDGKRVTIFYRVYFKVHEPYKKGFGSYSEEKAEAARQKSARTRDVPYNRRPRQRNRGAAEEPEEAAGLWETSGSFIMIPPGNASRGFLYSGGVAHIPGGLHGGGKERMNSGGLHGVHNNTVNYVCHVFTESDQAA